MKSATVKWKLKHVFRQQEFCTHKTLRGTLNVSEANKFQWPLTFKGRMIDISNAACTPQWPMLDISNAMRACSFSALTVFSRAGNPNKSTVGPTTRPGIRQEPLCNLW